jgi:hypothetical protein
METRTVSSASEVGVTKPKDKGHRVEVPLSPDSKVTMARHGLVVLRY